MNARHEDSLLGLLWWTSSDCRLHKGRTIKDSQYGWAVWKDIVPVSGKRVS